jgi:2-amino-4-hydroxy-6-hydroxymethyldihydropteridine diphosphokinase
LADIALIELGSNIKPEEHLPRAVAALARLGRVEAVSAAYQTEPFGPPGQPHFVNAAVRLLTELAPIDLRQELRAVEYALGRRRSADRYAPRPIDLDLCMYGQPPLQSDELALPDPDILARPYLARTLAEVAPDLVHPLTGQTLAELAQATSADDGTLHLAELSQQLGAQVRA